MNKDHDGFSRRECGPSCGPIEVPTEDERRALDALRNIKDRVREIRKRLADMNDRGEREADEKATLETELQRLKSEWKEWEVKRDQAARERMIRLGHIEPD